MPGSVIPENALLPERVPESFIPTTRPTEELPLTLGFSAAQFVTLPPPVPTTPPTLSLPLTVPPSKIVQLVYIVVYLFQFLFMLSILKTS